MDERDVDTTGAYNCLRSENVWVPALTEFGLDAVADFPGCVQVGDGIGRLVSHALKMRRRSAEREQIQLLPE